MSETEKILLIGLPATGKSTFLAALWYLVDGRNDTVLTLNRLQGDREYLNNIRDKWLICEQLERTRVENEQILSMSLENTKTKKILELTIPDLSGETFGNQWSKRSWTPEFESLITDSCGALLFVSPNQLDEPLRVEEADALVKEIANNNELIDEEIIEISEWDPEQSPTQVKLVELLQFIEDAHVTQTPFKISVIISAWDLVRNFGKTPTQWLEKNLPLFYQFLEAKKANFTYHIYGVSAQGADYFSENRLADHLNAADRIEIVNPDYAGHDITIPLARLMDHR